MRSFIVAIAVLCTACSLDWTEPFGGGGAGAGGDGGDGGDGGSAAADLQISITKPVDQEQPPAGWIIFEAAVVPDTAEFQWEQVFWFRGDAADAFGNGRGFEALLEAGTVGITVKLLSPDDAVRSMDSITIHVQ